MDFIEERLLECVTFGTVGGPTFSTRKVVLKSGITRRNPRRSRPLYRYSLIYKNLTPSQHAEVINAFNACYGGVHSFRLKDWMDFEAVDEQLSALGTGSPQSLQLIKTYEFGNSNNIVRPIRKPVHSTVILTANGTPISKTISSAGVVTFTAAASAVIRWSGEFDVPVMFEDDELLFSGNDRGVNGLFLTSDVSLIEDISV